MSLHVAERVKLLRKSEGTFALEFFPDPETGDRPPYELKIIARGGASLAQMMDGLASVLERREVWQEELAAFAATRAAGRAEPRARARTEERPRIPRRIRRRRCGGGSCDSTRRTGCTRRSPSWAASSKCTRGGSTS